MLVRRLVTGAGPLFAKETTGIVGLDVVPNAREVKAVESRLRVCEEEEDWEQIEKKLEELIEEAQDELTLISKMIEWDPWGVPDDYQCEVIENDAPVSKHVPLHRPGPLPEPRGVLQDAGGDYFCPKER
ncbi:hypothetical protein MKW92_042030 [Papaver armeniacum]|nr:hypothetical protein MKW92_042030 [Papaver armeniacum]